MPSVFFHRCDTSTSLPSTSRVTYPADMVPWNTPTVPSPGCPEYNTTYHPCTYLFRICVMPSISLPLALVRLPLCLSTDGNRVVDRQECQSKNFCWSIVFFCSSRDYVWGWVIWDGPGCAAHCIHRTGNPGKRVVGIAMTASALRPSEVRPQRQRHWPGAY